MSLYNHQMPLFRFVSGNQSRLNPGMESMLRGKSATSRKSPVKTISPPRYVEKMFPPRYLEVSVINSPARSAVNSPPTTAVDFPPRSSLHSPSLVTCKFYFSVDSILSSLVGFKTPLRTPFLCRL